VTSGGSAPWSRVERRKGRVAGGGIELRGTYKAFRRVRISRDALIKREA
jgi:hypothetical protein